MNIYLDESYNLQKEKGKMFISINGFSVLNDKILRKRWKVLRKPYTKLGRRIHATDSEFENLRNASIQLFLKNDANILSVFQLCQEIPYEYYNKNGIQFDFVYGELLKKLFGKLSFTEYRRVMIVIDTRTHKGGILGGKNFRKNIEEFLKIQFPYTTSIFKMTPSYRDILLELADFISNTFYKEYISDSDRIFKKFNYRLVQIKNPLKADL